MEIVLAIALTSVVMYLLATAVELYLVRVDSSRSRVESAQLARTLLDRIAADLVATRLYAPSPAAGGQGSGGAAGGGSGQNASGGSASGGQTGGNAPLPGSGSGNPSGGGNNPAGGGGQANGPGGAGSAGSGGTAATKSSSDVQGIYGTAELLRIDRSASADWQRAARAVEPTEGAAMVDMPASVRYYLVDGRQLTAQQLAARGVSADEPASDVSGLYREVIPTAALALQTDPLASPAQGESAALELLAPEVVKLEIAYFDGKQLVDSWDSFRSEGLPAGVEIILTLYEPSSHDADESRPTLSSAPSYRENELVEYRRFVRIPNISLPQPAEALLPAANGNQPGGGQPGGRPNGGGQGNSPGGGQNAGGGNGQNGQPGGASGS